MTKKKPTLGKAGIDQKTPDYYSTNRRAAKVIEATPDGHSVLIACPYCYQPHIHAAPTEADPLRLRKAPCDPSRTYILAEVAQ